MKQLLQELEAADPAEAPDLADETARVLTEALEGGREKDDAGESA